MDERETRPMTSTDSKRFEDEDGGAVYAEINQDRVHIFGAATYGRGAWLTPETAAEFALHVAQLANKLSADLAGDAEVLAAAGRIDALTQEMCPTCGKWGIGGEYCHSSESEPLPDFTRPDMSASRADAKIVAKLRALDPDGNPTQALRDLLTRAHICFNCGQSWENEGNDCKCTRPADVSTALAAHTAATLDAIGEIR
jgi:hypothetical protein